MLIFLIACVSPLVLSDLTVEMVVPSSLKDGHCLEGTHLVVDEMGSYCIDPVTQKKDGVFMQSSEQGIAVFFYEQDTPLTFPLFFTHKHAIDEKRSLEYSNGDRPVPLLLDYLEKFPTASNREDIAFRLMALGALPPSERSGTQEPCLVPCVMANSGVVELKENSDEGVKKVYQYFSHDTVYFDEQPASEADVQKCLDDCLCSEGEWNSFQVAQRYCQRQHKRLPTASEMLGYFKIDDAQAGVFLSSSEYSDRPHMTLVKKPWAACEDCSEESAYAVLRSDLELSSSKNNTGYTFFCVSEKPPPTYPVLLSSKPTTMPYTADIEPKSWGAKDKDYLSRLGKPVDDPLAFDYGYKDIYMVADALWAYHQKYPDITRLYELGRTRQGQPILALRVSNNPDSDEVEPSILINGAHHGDELLSVLVALKNVDYTLKNSSRSEVKRWLSKTDIWFVPLVNPDGNLMTLRRNKGRNIGRKNGHDTDGECQTKQYKEGVDLNRNYPFKWGVIPRGSSGEPLSDYYRGSASGSEPESSSLMELSKKYRFASAISWHTNGTMIISPYTIPGLENPSPDMPWMIAEELAAFTPEQPNGKEMIVKKSMYAVDGTDQDWHYHEHGTIAYIIEGSHHNPRSMTIRQQSVDGLLPIFIELMERTVNGPSVFGRIVNEENEPIEAVVKIKGHKMSEKENWTSRPADGFFYRYLPYENKKSMRIEIQADGYKSQLKKTTISSHPVDLGTIVLKTQ